VILRTRREHHDRRVIALVSRFLQTSARPRLKRARNVDHRVKVKCARGAARVVGDRAAARLPRDAALLPPDGDSSGSTLLAANNIGHVTLGDGKVTRRLIARTRAGTRVHEATMATGDDVLAAHNGRGVRA
jgi:hypothetical protein